MTMCYILTLSAGTSSVMTKSMTTMQIFIEIKKNFEGDKIAFKKSYDNQILTFVIIPYEIY